MCLQKSARFFLFLAALSVLAGCGAMDAIFPSSDSYKINVKINDETFDDISIVASKDIIQPFFEEPVSEDPDITELVVFLKDSRGQTAGYKATYSLTYSDNNNNNENKTELQQDDNNSKKENNKETVPEIQTKQDNAKTENQTEKDETDSANTDTTTPTTAANSVKTSGEKKDAQSGELVIPESIKHVIKGNEIIFPVKSLDDILPFFPLPSNLPIGKYTLVFQVMGKNIILYKNEKSFFFLADAEISFEGIQVNLPGIAGNSQFIQNGTVILLDAKINFDSRLDPYIIWYNGKKIIDEGRYSDGAGSLLWKAPDQNGFVSLHAEVFPSWEKTGLAGYQKGISILVSSKEVDMHLLSEDTPNLVQWYTFEGVLNDSISKDTEKKSIKPVEKKGPDWLSSNGTYGLTSGDNNTYKLPVIPFSKEEKNIWQITSRFKPLDDGDLFSVQFGPDFDATITLSNKESYLILKLASSLKTYSETVKLPDDNESFVTVSVKIIIQDGRLSAKLVLGSVNQTDTVINPISMEKDIDKEINIILGHQQKKPENNEQTAVVKKTFTALWDELAVLRLPYVEIIIIKEEKEAVPAEEAAPVEEELPETNIPSGDDEPHFIE